MFVFGDDESKLGEWAWFSDNGKNAGGKYAHHVGQKKPNPWGLCDMHGNVIEWCWDWYHTKLPGGRDPVATKEEESRVARGGSWIDAAENCRSAYRGAIAPMLRSHFLGFRVALSASRNK